MTIEEYISYWDDVITAWFNDDIQDKMLQKEIQNVLWNPNLKKHIHYDHMPEPYWGNQEEASVVILNFNPGGGDDKSPQTYKRCLGCNKNGATLLNYVHEHKYSSAAKDFPLLNNNPNLDTRLKYIATNYGGSKWWEGKEKWLNHLAEISEKAGKLPFAMELCGWHSKSWPSKALDNLNKKEGLGKHLWDTVILPMLDVIKKNDTIAICIGESIGNLLTLFGFKNTTPDLCQFIELEYRSDKCDHININNGKKQAEASDTNNKKGRNYRLLRSNDCYVINTWVNGSNKNPSIKYNDIEKKIINYINEFPITTREK